MDSLLVLLSDMCILLGELFIELNDG